jgi:pyridoxal phosphate enzyme (YggS family)
MDEPAILHANLARLRAEIAGAAARAGRDPGEVAVLPVTKSVAGATVRLLHGMGLREFAESRVQRGAGLAAELRDLADVRWHLVGHLQRNKVRRALDTFAVIHSLDSLRLAEEIAAQAHGRPPLEVYVEVNVAREGSKSGAPEDVLDDLLAYLQNAGCFTVMGLMAMAPQSDDPEAARPHFRRLCALRDERRRRGLLPPGAGLSMGMSSDFQVAVEEGATIVRIGTLLFAGLAGGAS